MLESKLTDKKLEYVCKDTEPSMRRCVENLGQKNRDILVEFLFTVQTEKNLASNSRRNYIYCLSKLSKYYIHKPFTQITNQDIIEFLNSFWKPEGLDPLHKWVWTYNLYFTLLKCFFKFLNKSECMQGIKELKRKEKSKYKPSDLWTQDDDLLFLKYCPSKRDKCYHMIARDSSCRPSEILKLKIKDVAFKLVGNKQYAEILVNGKTGSRHIPLISSIPYLKDWLDEHPMNNIPNASLICGVGRRKGAELSDSGTILMMYIRHREYFEDLLEDPNINPEDKIEIRELLKKPWNPYIRRHSALTDKSKILKEHILRQHPNAIG